MALKITRDRIALVVFIVMVLGTLAVLGIYFFASRSLTVAANRVDDTLGMMEGYTVIIYPGTLPITTSMPTTETPEADEDTSSTEGDKLSESNAAQTSAEGIEQTIDNEAATESGITILDQVTSQYELKGAMVVQLDLQNPDVYTTPRILSAGERKIGVFSIDRFYSRTRLKELTDALHNSGASILCLLTPDARFVKDPALVNLILETTSKPTLPATGHYVGSTLIVDLLPENSVGVVAVSASNVLSASQVSA